MNSKDWELLVKTALMGTARAPLPETFVLQTDAQGLGQDTDPARAALALLSSAQLLRKAGFPLSRMLLQSMPAPVPEARPDPAVAAFLDRMLSGVYPEALDEFFALLLAKGRLAPAEFLPALLDRAERNRHFFDKIRPALGALGEWLAAQNPAWRSLYQSAELNWETDPFAERLRWLRMTRQTHPLVALARLEKTWSAEGPEHKALFLQALSIRLSLLDEDFLEKILSKEKKKDLRLSALLLLSQIPESARKRELSAFFRDRLAGVFSAADPLRFLEKHLPELDEQPLAQWVSLLPAGQAGDWRIALTALLVELLPPADTLGLAKLAPDKLLDKIAAPKALQGILPALILSAARFMDMDWTEALLKLQERQPGLPFWNEEHLSMLINALPDTRKSAVLARMLRPDDALAEPSSIPLRLLRAFRQPWSKELLQAFAVQIGNFSYPQPQLRPLLELAAYQCSPGDAESLRSALDPDRMPGWRSELAHFFDVVQFRRRMQAAFEK